MLWYQDEAIAQYSNDLMDESGFPWHCNAVNHLTIHRLLLTCLLLAAKVLDDGGYYNKTYAFLGGISLSEMNKLEIALLSKLNYTTHVTRELFFEFSNNFFCLSSLPEIQP